MFLLTGGIYIVGNLIFILFGSTEVQKWNDPIKKKRDSENKESKTPKMTVMTIEKLKNNEIIP